MGRPIDEIRAEDALLIGHGWAPGNYTCTCLICGESFTADKRSLICRPHALAAYQGGIAPADIKDTAE